MQACMHLFIIKLFVVLLVLYLTGYSNNYLATTSLAYIDVLYWKGIIE